MEEDIKSIHDYIQIAKRRAGYIVISFLLLAGATVALAVLLPSIYQSKATILIESQQVPSEMVPSTITSFAEERIEVIKQRVMTSANLLRIINKYGLFKDNKSLLNSELVDKVSKNILIGQVTIDPRRKGGKSQSLTIAFTIAFENRSPQIAQAVTNELVTLFLDENTRTRTERATDTTRFLTKQTEKIKSQIEGIEEQINAYKTEYRDVLPEQRDFNKQMFGSAESTLQQTERSINTLIDRRTYLQAELTALKSLPAETSTKTKQPQSPASQLKEMKTQYVSFSAIYGNSHPDVLALKRKIDAFVRKYGDEEERAVLTEQLEAAETEHTSYQQRYSEQHPDVLNLKRRIAKLKVELEAIPPAPKHKKVGESKKAKNEAFIKLEAEMMTIPARLDTLKKERDVLRKRIAILEERILRTPLVGRGLVSLEWNYKNAISAYEKMNIKQQEALLAQNLEVERKAERFSLLEPPLLPGKPESPDRIKILMIGLFLSIMGGLGSAVAAEGLDNTIRGPRALAAILKQEPIAVIPYIQNQADISQLWRKRIIRPLAFLLVVTGSLATVHYYIKPLNLLWLALMGNLSLL